MTTGEWVSRMTYSANGRSNEFFRRMSVENEAYSANENGEGAIRRMRPIRRMRGYSAELIRPSVDFEWKSSRIKSQCSDTTLLDRLGIRKQSESNRKLLDSLWNSAESYSRVFQSKPTETVVIRGCKNNVEATIEHHGLRIELG
ncbi:hypothetical protein E3N88_19021 [Mikania micrantha]|uniref:Uncharacterized protein n=1 Tax=Mikania micrantha TaxID=192012 RepID=A0A5N6NPE6_9ASTR|nr:hypothetical protein E3N88_19021 [Mikania micrantha]